MSTYTPIATQTLGSAASSVIFSSIPQGYTDLILITSTKTSSAAADGAITCTVNGDTGSNYSHTALYGTGSSALSFRASNLTKLYFGRWGNAQYAVTKTQFNNYSNSTTYKTVLSQGGNTTDYIFNWVNLWRNTSAITSMELRVDDASNFATGSTFTLYGIAVGNSSAKADGGSSVTTDGTYYYHTYRSSGAFTPRQALTVDYLVVAGGGGGGHAYGGGGGGGGFRTSIGGSALSLSAQTYPVIVGAGGVRGYLGNGGSGGNSVFSTITSTGGGGGGTGGASGIAGGSGGGAGGGVPSTGSAGAGNTPSTSPSQGNSGGGGANESGGGGGGGAGTTGGSAGSGLGGNGGNGASSSISGSSVTYAGGGAGAGYISGSPTGGSGGGGNGTITGGGNAGNGTNNLGGGGGSPHNGGNLAGNGGSGVVIIRYAV